MPLASLYVYIKSINIFKRVSGNDNQSVRNVQNYSAKFSKANIEFTSSPGTCGTCLILMVAEVSLQYE